MNLGFRGFDLFIACCVIICHAVGNVGNLVAAVGESARSQAHRVAAGADGYAGTVNGRASSGYIAAKDCGSQAGQFFCQFDVQRPIVFVRNDADIVFRQFVRIVLSAFNGYGAA